MNSDSNLDTIIYEERCVSSFSRIHDSTMTKEWCRPMSRPRRGGGVSARIGWQQEAYSSFFSSASYSFNFTQKYVSSPSSSSLILFHLLMSVFFWSLNSSSSSSFSSSSRHPVSSPQSDDAAVRLRASRSRVPINR